MGRVTVAVGFISFAVLCGLPLHAQSPTPVPPQPTKDPAALSVLSQMVTATGWTPSHLPQDAIATGIISNPQGIDSPGTNFTVRVKNCGEFRVDVQDDSGPHTLIINGNGGALQSAGETDMIPALSAISIQPQILPFFCDLANFADPNVSVMLVGIETVAGQPASRIQLVRPQIAATSTSDPSSGAPMSAPPVRGPLTVWISNESGLPIQIAFTWVSTNNSSVSLTVCTLLSDFRFVSGVAVPYQQEQQAKGTTIQTMQLSSVNFNTGLSDADFVLPTSSE